METPKGIGKFTDLLRKLVTIPKGTVEQKIAEKKAIRKKRLKK